MGEVEEVEEIAAGPRVEAGRSRLGRSTTYRQQVAVEGLLLRQSRHEAVKGIGLV